MEGLAGKRVALVGGAGFIGHHLALRLADEGVDVHVIDGLTINNLLYYTALPSETENRDLYLAILNQRIDRLRGAGIPLHVEDARDYHRLSHVLSDIQPHVIVHLAAVAHAGKSNKDPMSTFDHSLRTLENSLDWARDGAEHIVYLSSSMVYGHFRRPVVAEDEPCEPLGIYGALKYAGEKMVIAYKQVFDLDYTIVRPSALYGPGCVSRRVSQTFIESALVGQKLRVDGEGEERLDFSWVGDVIDGLVRCIAHPNARNEIFNITTGNSRSLRELIEQVQAHFPEVEVEYVERDALRPYRGTLSIDKARAAMGYDPATTLEEGLEEYVAWYHDLIGEMAATGGSR